MPLPGRDYDLVKVLHKCVGPGAPCTRPGLPQLQPRNPHLGIFPGLVCVSPLHGRPASRYRANRDSENAAAPGSARGATSLMEEASVSA